MAVGKEEVGLPRQQSFSLTGLIAGEPREHEMINRLCMGLLVALMAGSASAQTQEELNAYEAENDVPPPSGIVRCVLDASMLYGPRGVVTTGFMAVTFQLRADGMGLVNGRLVEPLDFQLDGESSTATFSVSSFDLDRKSVAMSAFLPEDQKRELQQMNEYLSVQRSGGLPRNVTVRFFDHGVVAASIENGREVDLMSQQCR